MANKWKKNCYGVLLVYSIHPIFLDDSFEVGMAAKMHPQIHAVEVIGQKRSSVTLVQYQEETMESAGTNNCLLFILPLEADQYLCGFADIISSFLY
ncbi:hypothetical protein CEXT_507251 [Caerostris extrusa]|uniref:Uncharacterized protein n=1 Tax=Caerostris extrusa TaxID=172846 RepID=A0AAV4M744_CAEEX|nr:hypothetical protein CEXT_507251 [Caerostris extrusa]